MEQSKQKENDNGWRFPSVEEVKKKLEMHTILITACMAIHRRLEGIMEFNIFQTRLLVLAKLTAHFLRVRYTLCTHEAELVDHFIG